MQSVSRSLNIAFFLAIALAIAAYILRDGFHDEARFHFQGETIILHADKSIVVRDKSDRLETHYFGQSINLEACQFACVFYITGWTLWQIRSMLQKKKSPRGFDVIQ